MSKYESPIRVTHAGDFMWEVVKNEDIMVMETVKMHVDVDKDELLRALAYDRGQYEKGYKDGYEAARKEALDVLANITAIAKEYSHE